MLTFTAAYSDEQSPPLHCMSCPVLTSCPRKRLEETEYGSLLSCTCHLQVGPWYTSLRVHLLFFLLEVMVPPTTTLNPKKTDHGSYSSYCTCPLARALLSFHTVGRPSRTAESLPRAPLDESRTGLEDSGRGSNVPCPAQGLSPTYGPSY